MTDLDVHRYIKMVKQCTPVLCLGKVTEVRDISIEGTVPGVPIGGICSVFPRDNSVPIAAEVIGLRRGKTIMMPLGKPTGVALGSLITSRRSEAKAKVGVDLLGRVIDGLGNPIDGKGPIQTEGEYPLYASPINPLHRHRITEPLDLGIKVINGALTVGKGQRMAIMAGSGVGKSVLLGMIARYTNADVNVIGLIGERGREVREFIEGNLGEEGLKRSVVIAATSDQSPLVRMRGAYVATAVAEYFRARGKAVLLMMDSVTRFAMALRDVGLARGEPPATKAYTPSVFARLPELLERAGPLNNGSITALYTVLAEGDDMNDPIPDTVRSIVDGHMVLSRRLASRGHYPSIDILNSVSRVMPDIVSKKHLDLVRELREAVSVYNEAEDLINIGAYKKGANPGIDHAAAKIDLINTYLRQHIDEKYDYDASVSLLDGIFKDDRAVEEGVQDGKGEKVGHDVERTIMPITLAQEEVGLS